MQETCTITFTDVIGPLFVIAECRPPRECPATLQCLYPQFNKKQYGWMLSIEELEFLCHDGPNHGVQVVLGSTAVVELRARLREMHPAACALYRILTSEHRYQLHHGSQFGALYIGYQGAIIHGESLFFLGPLSELEAVRSSRVAGSVGKRPYVCTWDACTGVAEVRVLEDVSKVSVPPKQKRRRVL